MKSFTLFFATVILLFVPMTTNAVAYEDRTIYTYDDYMSEDLNLDAVASLFGVSRDLADFEWRLNDPNNQISNLDLNGDYRVDYLRVVETMQRDLRIITIQAIIGKNQYQDVATIELYRDDYERTTLEIVGDPYIYGSNFIVEPHYRYIPAIYSYLWTTPHYRPYYSRYNWNYYPRQYRTWKRRTPKLYRHHIYHHVDRRNHYKYTSSRVHNHRNHNHNSNNYRTNKPINHNHYNRSKTTQTTNSRNKNSNSYNPSKVANNRSKNHNRSQVIQTTHSNRNPKIYNSSKTVRKTSIVPTNRISNRHNKSQTIQTTHKSNRSSRTYTNSRVTPRTRTTTNELSARTNAPKTSRSTSRTNTYKSIHKRTTTRNRDQKRQREEIDKQINGY